MPSIMIFIYVNGKKTDIKISVEIPCKSVLQFILVFVSLVTHDLFLWHIQKAQLCHLVGRHA